MQSAGGHVFVHRALRGSAEVYCCLGTSGTVGVVQDKQSILTRCKLCKHYYINHYMSDFNSQVPQGDHKG